MAAPAAAGPFLPRSDEAAADSRSAPLRRLLRRLTWLPRAYARAWRQVRPTREGWVFLATSGAVAMAALNTGNNLLYLVFASMLSLVVLSGVLSESSLRGLSVERSITGRAFAGSPAAGRWTLRSRRRVLPALAITLEEIHSNDADLRDSRGAVFPWVRASSESSRDGAWTFRRRGRHRLVRVRVSTSWPFGIFRKWYELSNPLELLVYPTIDEAVAAPPPSTGRAGEGERGRALRHGSGDLRGLRDHRTGDDWRRIHWRSTLRHGRPIVAEREGEDAGEIELRLGAPATPGGGPADSTRLAAFDRAVERVASQAVVALRSGQRVTLLGPRGERIGPAAGEEGVDTLLCFLATVDLPGPLPGPPAPTLGSGDAIARGLRP